MYVVEETMQQIQAVGELGTVCHSVFSNDVCVLRLSRKFPGVPQKKRINYILKDAKVKVGALPKTPTIASDGSVVDSVPAAVIWEIILRDFWGDILRPLVTPYRRSNANARGLSI
jgi:hypothetical protein